MFIIKKIANHCLNLQIIINLLFEHVIMTSKYSKQMQINSNIMVIYLTSECLIWTKRKGHTVHIKTEAKEHTYSKG